MLEAIENRVKELEAALNNSIASPAIMQHNFLAVQLAEARNILEMVKKGATAVENVATDVEKVIDAVSPQESESGTQAS